MKISFIAVVLWWIWNQVVKGKTKRIDQRIGPLQGINSWFLIYANSKIVSYENDPMKHYLKHLCKSLKFYKRLKTSTKRWRPFLTKKPHKYILLKYSLWDRDRGTFSSSSLYFLYEVDYKNFRLNSNGEFSLLLCNLAYDWWWCSFSLAHTPVLFTWLLTATLCFAEQIIPSSHKKKRSCRVNETRKRCPFPDTVVYLTGI